MTATEAKVRKRNNNENGQKPATTKTVKKHAGEKRSKINAINEELKAATSSHMHRSWIRTVIVVAAMVVAYFYAKNRDLRGQTLASVRLLKNAPFHRFNCSPSYEAEMQDYPKCVPQKCGRFVSDQIVDVKEAEQLLQLARSVISKAGSTGGASILDLHTGALSYGTEFLNFYKSPEILAHVQEEQLVTYNFIKNKIKTTIATQFNIPASSLYLTYPTFFSRLTNVTAKTIHDEYWHEHIDKETYPSFHYTSLLYLTSFNKDFKGGRFLFVDHTSTANRTYAIEPRAGRVSAFTSGAENRHYVEQVTEGERYAVTISFTCDPKLGIADPKIKTA